MSYSNPAVSRGVPYEVQQTDRGNRFNSQKNFTGINGVTVWFLFENPADSGIVVRLQKRVLKPELEGIDNFQILWDYDVDNATAIAMPIYNQNNRFRTLKPGKAEVSVLNPVTVPAPGVNNDEWTITGPFTPNDQGIEREPDFIATLGTPAAPQSSPGDISPELGVRDYYPGTGFLTRAVMDDSGRLIWGYDWFEEPV